MTTLIFGRSGQVARALKKRLPDARTIPSDQADFLQPETVLEVLEQHQPKIIINAAAYTAVDKAEEEELKAMQINALTPGLIAEWASKNDALLIHYSTDYVFNGSGDQPWDETDATDPLSAYGRSKLLGEQELARVGGRHVILRLCWVYDEKGANFLNTMLRLGKDRRDLSIVADQIGAPTYAGDIAEATAKVLEHANPPSGVYHFCNRGETNWADFARIIFAEAGLGVEVHSIATEEYPTPAKRPANSRLSTKKFSKIFGWSPIPDWQDALKRCMLEVTK